MKKFIALLTALVMVLSFAGCGKDKDVRGTVSGNNTEIDIPTLDDVLVKPGEDGDGAEEAEFSMGHVDGLTYENSFIGLGCTLSSDWIFYDDEQIREINNFSADLAGEDIAEQIKKADLVYDMYAMNQDGTCNINVNLQKAPALQLAALNVADALESQMPMLKTGLENMGYENISCTLAKVTVAGKEYDAIKVTGSLSGMNLYNVIFSKKCSGYLASITVGSFGDDQTGEILGCFYNV